MANPEHVAKLKEGVKSWNNWRKTAGQVEIELSQEDFSGANLIGADLGGAKLGGAKLTGAKLRAADLTGADLGEADLGGAKLSGAKLRSANLTHADLGEADLIGTDLSRAAVGDMRLGWTVFANTNLTETQGLESCDHQGPSTIGIDTFFLSGGNIPEAFLRGCGVPEQFITYARSLVTSPFEFYSCFISYSSKDHTFAERLNADLRAKNLRCWFAPEDLKIGDRFQESMEESIRLFDKVMIVLSDASIKSRWVEREMNAAREREDRENRTVLFPIRIDDAVMDASQPWAADIRRSRHIGDFSRWKDHDSYTRGFERLLRDLQAKGSAAAQEA